MRRQQETEGERRKEKEDYRWKKEERQERTREISQ